MTIKCRIREKAIRSILAVLIVFGTGIYSCTVQARSFAQGKAEHSIRGEELLNLSVGLFERSEGTIDVTKEKICDKK